MPIEGAVFSNGSIWSGTGNVTYNSTVEAAGQVNISGTDRFFVRQKLIPGRRRRTSNTPGRLRSPNRTPTRFSFPLGPPPVRTTLRPTCWRSSRSRPQPWPLPCPWPMKLRIKSMILMLPPWSSPTGPGESAAAHPGAIISPSTSRTPCPLPDCRPRELGSVDE